MNGYYAEKLAASRLKQCYDLGSARVRQYLEAEVQHVLSHLRPRDLVLDLGCGYGRVMPALAEKARWVVGIDNSVASLALAREYLKDVPNTLLIEMDASRLQFVDGTFDLTICIQNGISAFHTDQRRLIAEAVRVTAPGGTVLFSGYAEAFWDHRLEWFRRQADAGLLGEIDFQQTGNGVIVCKDGFKATTVSAAEFSALAAGLNVSVNLVEVDQSSLFCEMKKPL